MAFTYFFRDQQTIELIVKLLVPEVQGKRQVKIWDAGCAHGPEPYTLAIILAENMGTFAFKNVKIDATDIDNSNTFGNIIHQGVYPYTELKRIPKAIFKKYFNQVPEDDSYLIDYIIRTRVSFYRHNLLSLEPVSDKYSLILCKNVLLHFKHSQRVAVIKMFYESLTPGGLLAMEQTQVLPPETKGLFERLTDQSQIYRKISL